MQIFLQDCVCPAEGGCTRGTNSQTKLCGHSERSPLVPKMKANLKALKDVDGYIPKND